MVLHLKIYINPKNKKHILFDIDWKGARKLDEIIKKIK